MDATFRRDVRTHFFQGKEGTSLDRYVRTANDILFNPEGTIKPVEQAYEEELEADSVDDAQASEASQEWLDVQSRFHDSSYRNTLIIKRQCPEATRVAGYRTWQEEFDRHAQKGNRPFGSVRRSSRSSARSARTRRATTKAER